MALKTYKVELNINLKLKIRKNKKFRSNQQKLISFKKT